MAEADTLEPTGTAPHLKRSLKLWHLIVYGIIIIQPTAPMGIYGVVSNEARGHVVTTILIAMVAMLFTAISYGRMARVYPSAGSAFTYVGKELHPLAGYVVGWSMLMDYLLNPIICAIWCSAAAAEHPSRHTVCHVGGFVCHPLHCAQSLRRQKLRQRERRAGLAHGAGRGHLPGLCHPLSGVRRASCRRPVAHAFL